MTPPPAGWPRITPAVFYRDAAAMIDWLCEAFGFTIRLKVVGEEGRIEHSELEYGDGLIMVGQERDAAQRFGAKFISPQTAGGNTQNLMLYVDALDAHCERARRAGARIVDEPSVHDYGDDYWVDRSYGALDPEGHLWWISERVRTGAPA